MSANAEPTFDASTLKEKIAECVDLARWGKDVDPTLLKIYASVDGLAKPFDIETFMDEVVKGISENPDLSLSRYEVRRCWNVVRQALIKHGIWTPEVDKK